MRRESVYGLTRADSLAVLVLGVFLLAVAGPLASRPRAQARRVVCRANLGQIGKAMLIYAGDYNGALPRAGGPSSRWEAVVWNAADRYAAHDLLPNGEGGKATISSCLYLLVKYMEMPPKLFVCPGDLKTTPFKLADESANIPTDFELIDAWDFGLDPGDNCSYTYHIPFGQYALKTSRDPNLPVAADRNPWIKSPASDPDTDRWARFVPDVPPYGGKVEYARRGNAISHEDDGQNVLFLDGRVAFESRAFCGLDNDNIYTRSIISGEGDPKGETPVPIPALQPASERDSLLVHDPDSFSGSRARR